MLNVDDALATHNKKNKAKQSIDQSQSSNQNAGCLSGGTTFISCNNLVSNTKRTVETTH